MESEIKGMLENLYEGAEVIVIDEKSEKKEGEKIFYKEGLELEIRRLSRLEREDRLVLRRVVLDQEFKPIEFEWVLESVADAVRGLVPDEEKIEYQYLLRGVDSDATSTDRSVIIKRDRSVGKSEAGQEVLLAEYFIEDNGWEVPDGTLVGEDEDLYGEILKLFGAEEDESLGLDSQVMCVVMEYLERCKPEVGDGLGAVLPFSVADVETREMVYEDNLIVVTKDGGENYCAWVKVDIVDRKRKLGV